MYSLLKSAARQEAARLLKASRTEQARLHMPLFILLGLYTGRRKEAILDRALGVAPAHEGA